MRAFLAFALPETLRMRLAEVTGRIGSSLPDRAMRWVPAENLHVTAVFLGEVEDGRIVALQGSILEAVSAFQPAELVCAGLGCFPNARRPRVLWAGVHGPPATPRLIRALASASGAFSSNSHENAQSMHVTLARARDPRDKDVGPSLEPLIASYREREFGHFALDRVTLYRSEPGPSGSRYSIIREFPLLHD